MTNDVILYYKYISSLKLYCRSNINTGPISDTVTLQTEVTAGKRIRSIRWIVTSSGKGFVRSG